MSVRRRQLPPTTTNLDFSNKRRSSFFLENDEVARQDVESMKARTGMKYNYSRPSTTATF